MADATYEELLAEEVALARVQSMAVRLLAARGLKQVDLARRMQVSEAHVSDLFADEPKNLSIKKAARLFYHLGEDLNFTCKGIEMLDKEAHKRNAIKAEIALHSDAFCWARHANDASDEDCQKTFRSPVAA